MSENEISEIQKSHAAMFVATTETHKREMENLVASHDKTITEMKDAHTKELAASAETHAIDLAKQRRGLEKSAHEALLKEKHGHDEIVGKLEAAHARAETVFLDRLATSAQQARASTPPQMAALGRAKTVLTCTTTTQQPIMLLAHFRNVQLVRG